MDAPKRWAAAIAALSVVFVTYFEGVAIGVEHVDGDLDVLLDTLASSLELAALQGEVQVVADVSWDGQGGGKEG